MSKPTMLKSTDILETNTRATSTIELILYKFKLHKLIPRCRHMMRFKNTILEYINYPFLIGFSRL